MANAQPTKLVAISQESEFASPVDYTTEQVQLIKNTYAKGATDAELALFIAIAKRKGLDIFAKQICLVPRWDPKLRIEVKDPQTTIDGYRLIAERTGRYVPGRETSYTYNQSGYVLSATAYVKKLVAGEWHEIACTAHYSEYVQYTREGKVNAIWNKMPHVMLGKCAESLALRKAFPAELSGIYTQEEMGSVTIEEERQSFTERPAPKALPAPVEQIIEAEPVDVSGLVEEAQSIDSPEWDDIGSTQPAISKASMIKIAHLCKKLEEAGVAEEEWRTQLHRITGKRSRKDLVEGEVGEVLKLFAGMLNEINDSKKKARR